MSGGFKAVGNLASNVLKGTGLIKPKAPIVNLPSGRAFAGLVTPGLSLLGNQQGQFELSRSGQDPAAQEAALLSSLQGIQGGLVGLRAGLAPLRGGFASLAQQFPGLRDQSAALGQQIQGLLGEVRSGFGRLTESLVRGVRDREAASVGNLRSALAKRNVLGSSFAQRELERTGLDFAQEEGRVRSGAFAQELAASQGLIEQAGKLLEMDASLIQGEAASLGLQLGLSQAEAQMFGQEMATIQQQQALILQSINRQLQELGISGNISNSAQAVISNISTTNALFAAQAAADQGAAFGNLLEFVAPKGLFGQGGPFGSSST